MLAGSAICNNFACTPQNASRWLADSFPECQITTLGMGTLSRSALQKVIKATHAKIKRRFRRMVAIVDTRLQAVTREFPTKVQSKIF
jgi:hypothetical protein